MNQPLVTNTENEEQLREAKDKEMSMRDRELNDLRGILATPGGRRAMWRILSEFGAFRSIFEASAKIYYNAGKQDSAHWLMEELNEASEEHFFEMQKEHFNKTKGKK